MMGNGVVIFTAVILSLSGVANVSSLAFIISREKLRTQSNLYISSLILADLCLTSSMTLHYIDSAGLYTGLYINEVQCSILTYLEISFLAASTGSVLLISLDVRNAVLFAATYTKLPKEAFRKLALVWVFACIYGSRMFVQFIVSKSIESDSNDDDRSLANNSTETISHNEEQKPKFCNLITEEETSDIYFRAFDLAVLFVAPIVALFLFGYQILSYINDKTVNTVGRIERRRRIQVRSAIGIAAFFICWAPFYLVDIITDAKELIMDGESDDDDKDENGSATYFIRMAVNLLANLHCFINLVIYAWMNRNFREQIRVALRKLRGTFQNEVDVAPQ